MLPRKSNKYYTFWEKERVYYIVIRLSVWLYHIFPHCLIYGPIFRVKNVIEPKMCALILSTTFVWNISYSENNSARYRHKCENVLMWSTRYSCQILMKLEFSEQGFQTGSNIKFHQNSSSGSWVVLCVRMDRRTDMMKIILAFFNYAKAPRNGCTKVCAVLMSV